LPPHEPVWLDTDWRRAVRRRLLPWFQSHARQLPWRREVTPYRVWISEIMLQQTQVATVIPYFERFLESFPTVESLADADEQTLLSHWEGLGYYRRARSLQAAARQIVSQHGGKFPEDFAQLLALPGIGRYTAGAVLSISREQRWPILEGNSQRVLSRWVALRGGATDPASNRLLWQIAEAMLPRKQPGKFNQAVMELGALVCSPKQPRCDDCPLNQLCEARAAGLQDQIPGKVSRVVYEDRIEFALIVADRSGVGRGPDPSLRYLLRPLPEGSRWAGLWDFPRTTETSHPSAAAAAQQLSDELGVELSAGKRLTSIKHAVTKYRILLHVHLAELDAGAPSPRIPWRYVSLTEMAKLPMSVTGRRIARMLCDESPLPSPLG
jgi:A/G-specific adenine glycosylase